MATLKYDLASLTWQQFEVLAYKCLQIDVSPSLQFIEGGNDKGRDFLFKGQTAFSGGVNSFDHLFQVKHKSNTGDFFALQYDLKTELHKVYVKNQLKYNFYCLVTNLTINGTEFDQLTEIFETFFKENNLSFQVTFAVYSYRNLETVIDKTDYLKWEFPSIVSKADFRILLDKILNKSHVAIQAGWENLFERNREKFVYTGIYEEALNKLRSENIILLSGPPKSGKTFTAEMIMFNTLCSEGYSPYKIDKVEEFESFFDTNQKQVFLFDDIFGKHDLDAYRADSVDRKFELIFELIDDDHKCLFTSREYIVRAFSDYSDSELSKLISKILVDTNKLTSAEKQSLFVRYFTLKFPALEILSEPAIKAITDHKNFSPETIRAYFEESNEFNYKEFLQHLELPDKYLEKVFVNLPEEKRITLLSLLFSLHENERTIAYAFNNLSQDLSKKYLINLKNELNLLDGSLVKIQSEHYSFYHPSMLDFFVLYLGSDIATYRTILLKNLNLNLISFLRFKESPNRRKVILLEQAELSNVITGFQRVIKNPFATLFELNSILSWLRLSDTQFYLKAKYKGEFKSFQTGVFEAIKSLQLNKFKNDDAYVLADFFDFIRIDGHKTSLNEADIIDILRFRKNDNLFWLIVFKLAPFLDDEVVLSEDNVGRKWLNGFFLDLKNELNELGHELYGSAYPDFPKLEPYRQLIEQKKHKEASELEFKQKSDFKQPTNNRWYPRYKVCKLKMNTLKSSHPLGYKIYELLLPNFQHLTILEDNQKNRYLFNRAKKWWD